MYKSFSYGHFATTEVRHQAIRHPNFIKFLVRSLQKNDQLLGAKSPVTTNLTSGFLTHEARAHCKSLAIFIQTKTLDVGYGRQSSVFFVVLFTSSIFILQFSDHKFDYREKMPQSCTTFTLSTKRKTARLLRIIRAWLHRHTTGYPLDMCSFVRQPAA